MIRRCYDPKHCGYTLYGERGIKVCKRWRGNNGLLNFIKDMGKPPSQNHTLDKIDNNKNYSKLNCRWATIEEQNRNKRNNIWLTYDKKTKLLITWAQEFGIKYQTLWRRLFRYNWNIEKALTTPIRRKKCQNTETQ